MSIGIGALAPDFTADSTAGLVSFHAWKGPRWAMLFSHPADFTPVCTTEIAAVAALQPEFEARGVRVIGLSVDSLESHYRWLDDVRELTGLAVSFPVVADPNCAVASLYGLVHPARRGLDATRSTLLVDPEDSVRMIQSYPDEVGRDFHEVLRVLDALRLAEAHGVATPAGWHPGEDVLLPVHVTEREAQARFPQGIRTRKPYLRIAPCPGPTRMPERAPPR